MAVQLLWKWKMPILLAPAFGHLGNAHEYAWTNEKEWLRGHVDCVGWGASKLVFAAFTAQAPSLTHRHQMLICRTFATGG
jgi:hypothetical protein